MGVEQNINAYRYPKQGSWLGWSVMVCYEYDTTKQFPGKIIRYDVEEPGRGIIHLENGRVLLTTECQFTLVAPPPTNPEV